jgi:short-subunit dehydrogenase
MRTVWVTGAGKGIGRAVAADLAARGDTVAISARTASDLHSLAEECRSAPGKIVAFPLDVTDVEAAARVAREIEEKLGPLDVAILNAGTHAPISAREFDAAAVRKLFETNLMGAAHCLDAILPRFIARRGGRIVVVGSVAGYFGMPSAAGYGATKAALINMCEALKPELDRCGVMLQLVNPGFVKTPLTDKNEFKMPFLMEVEDAAHRLCDALDSGAFEVTFPRRFTWILKFVRLLPYPVLFALTRRIAKD